MSSIILETEKVYLKLDMLTWEARASILNSAEAMENSNLYTALFSWMEPIEDQEGFNKKYTAFKNLEQIFNMTGLFPMIKSLNDNTTDQEIEQAISCYQNIIGIKQFQEISDYAAYHLPNKFGQSESYKDKSIQKNVEFFEKFSKEITKIKDKITGKEVYDDDRHK